MVLLHLSRYCPPTLASVCSRHIHGVGALGIRLSSSGRIVMSFATKFVERLLSADSPLLLEGERRLRARLLRE